MSNLTQKNEKSILGEVKIDIDFFDRHLKDVIKDIVEQALNSCLDAEADLLCNAGKYEHCDDRLDTRAGSYKRKLKTKVGELELTIPKLRTLPFHSNIIKRYQRSEMSFEEACAEMYYAGLSTRTVSDITKSLYDASVSPSKISVLNKRVYDDLEKWRTRPLDKEYPYLFVDGIYIKRNWGGEIHNVAMLIAVGVDFTGKREVIGVAEGSREDKESWSNFFRYLNERGVKGVKMVISDKASGLSDLIYQFYPNAKWQRCIVHWYRNVGSKCPTKHMKTVMAMVKAIHAQENREAAKEKAEKVMEKLREMHLAKIADYVKSSIDETLSYMSFPIEHWKRIRTNNMVERLNEEIRRRTKIVSSYPTDESALMIVTARVKRIAACWDQRQYIDVCKMNINDVD
jgi:transposase-like protein